jgi:hypothetical protein
MPIIYLVWFPAFLGDARFLAPESPGADAHRSGLLRKGCDEPRADVACDHPGAIIF